jgi:hypothetical protein
VLHHQPHGTLPDLSRIPLALGCHRPILSSDQASNLPGAVHFYDSAASVEIQVADIIAGIMRKKYIDGWRRPYMNKLKERLLRKEMGELCLLQFAELERFAYPTQTSNIYEEFARTPKDP